MAWRSSGTTNDEMVNNLKRFGVIHSLAVEEGFRAVDRRFFVPRNRQGMAHSDQPLKEGNVHISAPHIYGSVVEALELTPNSSLSFLNIGSGTGYLSCIVAEILGPTSTHYGVEIYQDVVEHCREAMTNWKAARTSDRPVPQMDIIFGNGLQIDSLRGESSAGLDRIYIGAAVERRNLCQLAGMLKPGGILVGPVGDELVKVIRISQTNSPQENLPRSFRGLSPPLSEDFSQQVLSGVRFAPLVRHPSIPIVLPSRVWSPDVHAYYPETFRSACKEILLCSHASPTQPPPQPHQMRVNVASKLPRALWMEILSYTRRDWFDQPHDCEAFLRRRLREEQASAHRAQEARLAAEARLHMLEKERDVYRLLALRWKRRVQDLTNIRGEREGNADDFLSGIDDIAAAAIADEPLLIGLGGLGAMLRRLRAAAMSDDDDDDDHEDDNDDAADMEDDSNGSDDGDAMQETLEDMEPMPVSGAEIRPQTRTISITSDDL